MPTPNYKFVKAWRVLHPHYTRDWNRKRRKDKVYRKRELMLQRERRKLLAE